MITAEQIIDMDLGELKADFASLMGTVVKQYGDGKPEESTTEEEAEIDEQA